MAVTFQIFRSFFFFLFIFGLSCPWKRKTFFVSCWPFVVYRRRDDHFRSKGHSLDVRLYCFKLYTQNPFVVLCSYVILYAHISAAIPKWFPTRSRRHWGEKLKQKAKKVNGQFLSNSSHILSFPIRFFITTNLNAREKNKLSCSWSNRKFWVFLFQTVYRGAVCSPSSIWHPQSPIRLNGNSEGAPLLCPVCSSLYTRRRVYIFIFFDRNSSLRTIPNNKAELFITTFGLNTISIRVVCVCYVDR